jgi:Putative prokaryotic signal transducing protein
MKVRMDHPTQCVFVANGELHAQQVRAFLEAAGIATIERGEALRHTHGLTLDGLGAVAILVAPSDVEHARSLLDSAEAGRFRLADDDPETFDSGPSQHTKP